MGDFTQVNSLKSNKRYSYIEGEQKETQVTPIKND